jgi:hypothetical protein
LYLLGKFELNEDLRELKGVRELRFNCLQPCKHDR